MFGYVHKKSEFEQYIYVKTIFGVYIFVSSKNQEKNWKPLKIYKSNLNLKNHLILTKVDSNMQINSNLYNFKLNNFEC
jgi:hypothetical protein